MTFYPLEVPRGHRSDIPIVVKATVRFARHLRQRRIAATFPVVVTPRDGATILAGGRVIHIDYLGSFSPQFSGASTPAGWKSDRCGYVAFLARMHANFLYIAAVDRGLGLFKTGTAMVEAARHDRIGYSQRKIS